MGILDIVMIAAAVCLKEVNTPLFIGILLGNIYALLNFALLGTIVRNAVERNPISAKRYMRTHYFIRWLLMGAVFAAAFAAPFVNGWCVVISAFAPKLTYTALGIYQSLFNKEGENIGN